MARRPTSSRGARASSKADSIPDADVENVAVEEDDDGPPPCFDCDELLNPPEPPPPPYSGREPTDAEAEEAGKWYRERYAQAMARATAGELRSLSQALVPAFTKSVIPAVIGAVIGFAIGFVMNAYLMAAKYDGYNVPSGSIATGVGNPLWGPAFWGVASAVVGTVVGFRLQAGKEQFWKQLRQFPSRIKSTFKLDGDRGLPDLLWGIAGSMFVASLLPPSMSGAFAGGFLIVVATALKRIVAGMLMVAWQWLAARITPGAPIQTVRTFEVAVLGTTAGLAMSFLMPGGGAIRLAVAIVAAGAAFGLRKGVLKPQAATLVILVLGAVVLIGILGDPAAADDGGYPECGEPGLLSWLTDCGGSTKVLRRAFIGGMLSLLGPLFGIPAGAVTAELIDEYEDEIFGPEEEDIPGAGGCDGESETSGSGSGALKQQLKRHPDTPLDQSWLLTRTLKNAWNDYQSGDMIVRTETMARHTPAALMKVIMDDTLPIGQGLINAKAYVDSGKGEAALKNFFNRPSKDVNRDIVNGLLSFQRGEDPFSNGVRRAADQTLADMNKFGNEYSEALARNDQQALGLLHAKASANVAYQVVSNADLPLGLGEVPFKGAAINLKRGVGDLAQRFRPVKVNDVERALLLDAEASLRAGPVPRRVNEVERALTLDAQASQRLNAGQTPNADGTTTIRLPPVTRPRAEIESTLAKAMEKAPEGSIVRVPLTPEEVEAFNVNRMTALNLHETGLREGTFVHMKLGEEYGPAVRAATPDGVFKPNSMGAKSLTPEEARFLDVDLSRRGHIYHYQPTALPDASDPSFGKVQFRMNNWDALDAEMTKLRTKGGYGIDENGNKYHYRVDVEPDGRVVMIEKNGKPVEARPFIIDEDTADWGAAPGRRIPLKDEHGRPLRDAKGKQVYLDQDLPPTVTDEVLQSWLYKQSHGRIAGEGRTRAWVIDPNDPLYASDMEKLRLDLAKKSTTLEKLAAEGHVLIDGDGIFLCKIKPKTKKPKATKAPPPRAPKTTKAKGTSTRPTPAPAPRRTK